MQKTKLYCGLCTYSCLACSAELAPETGDSSAEKFSSGLAQESPKKNMYQEVSGVVMGHVPACSAEQVLAPYNAYTYIPNIYFKVYL